MTAFTNFAAACQAPGFFSFPTWYKYLDSFNDAAGNCTPRISGIADVWLIVAAIIEMLLRIGALAAVVFVLWGGIQFIISHGEPEKTSKAQSTIINALIGLVISVGAATVVSFVAGKF